MRANNVLGIVFANVHDDLLKPLTKVRSMASVPFGGRYRMIDFTLSNLVNAGISSVGIITKLRYQSLMDHVQNGKAWDLDRRKGGLVILPPYGDVGSRGVYRGHIDALNNVMPYLKHCSEEYVVLCDTDVVSNVNISDMIEKHIASGADFTVAYTEGKLPLNHEDIMVFEFGEDSFVKKIKFPKKSNNAFYSLDIIVTKRKMLMEVIPELASKDATSIARNLLGPNTEKYKVLGYKTDGFSYVMDSLETYYNANMELLKKQVREDLFTKERPVYTKTHDRMPTRYGVNSSVKNSLIADGCVIEGNVENSVISRGVVVKKGATVKNSVLMQDTVIGENSVILNTITDKDAIITENKKVIGKDKIKVIEKGKII